MDVIFAWCNFHDVSLAEIHTSARRFAYELVDNLICIMIISLLWQLWLCCMLLLYKLDSNTIFVKDLMHLKSPPNSPLYTCTRGLYHIVADNLIFISKWMFHHINMLNLLSGYQHIRMYDINSGDTTPIINYEGIPKNVTSVGFQEEGKWMFTGGEDCTARIWDLRWVLSLT